MITGAIATRQRSIIPGFGLSLGVMLSYLGLIVIIPLCVLLLKAADAGWAKIWTELSRCERSRPSGSASGSRFSPLPSTRRSASSWPGYWCATSFSDAG